MQYKIYSIVFQFFMIFNQHDLTNCKALKGRNIRSVDRGQYTYVVAIAEYDEEQNGTESIVCTGSLLTKSHVLTAEHCFDEIEEGKFHVIAGSHRLNNCKRYQASWWISYDQWARAVDRPLFHPSSDIAIIKLVKTIRESFTAAILSSVNLEQILLNNTVLIVGWGDVNTDRSPEKLKVAKVKIVPQTECANTVGRVLNDTIMVPPQYMCTQAQPFVLASYGDSGGPLLYNEEIVGVTRGVFPDDTDQRIPETFNIHLQTRFYSVFINSIINAE